MIDEIGLIIVKIEKAYGMRCSVCGSTKMGIASSGPEGTYYACNSKEAQFIGRGFSPYSKEYNDALDHYRNSRIRVDYEALSTAKNIISIIKHKERIT